MSLRGRVRRNGDYPIPQDNETLTKKTIRIGTIQTFLLVTHETNKSIHIYVGGHDKWCIYCDIIKDMDTKRIKEMGYITKIRFDISCSLEHTFARGGDTKMLIKFLIQYIFNTYPTVRELAFNDLSVRTCDNDTDVNLAVMTYLYSEETWYMKNFSAHVLPSYDNEWTNIKTRYEKTIEINSRTPECLKDTMTCTERRTPECVSNTMSCTERRTPEITRRVNKVDWETVKETIRNDSTITKMSDYDMEELYHSTLSWREFFEPIYNKIHIDKFCIFISSWINTFIIKYFDTLQGLKYAMPIKDYGIQYTESEYKRGGKRFTRKATRKRAKDYH